MTVYMGLIHSTKSGYDVTFPDAPGCTASGDTPKEVMSAGTHRRGHRRGCAPCAVRADRQGGRAHADKHHNGHRPARGGG